jgi:hypothetical protein
MAGKLTGLVIGVLVGWCIAGSAVAVQPACRTVKIWETHGLTKVVLLPEEVAQLRAAAASTDPAAIGNAQNVIWARYRPGFDCGPLPTDTDCVEWAADWTQLYHACSK